tara:strand:+ start:1905 stop:2228 length:324 start_codon:yes stop_codon:yes gene_type:complete
MTFFEYNQTIYLIITTEKNKDNAYKISNPLLAEKLAACVTFKNIESHFLWKGKINQIKEIQLIIKCKEENIKKIVQKISECHSYEVPEIIYFPVSANSNYHQWVNSF